MKSNTVTLSIAIIAGFFAGYIGDASHTFLNPKTQPAQETTSSINEDKINPFILNTDSDELEYQVTSLQLEVENLKNQVISLEGKINTNISNKTNEEKNNSRKIKTHVSPNKENLILSGVNPDIAEDILRRISQQDYRRLELQNLMQRSKSLTRRQYSKELRELNQNKISLRSEMGDEIYDQYLYTSGQNNRVKVTSVMSGSPAESSGLQSDDVILYYGNQKILGWSDVKSATMQGEIGGYTNIEILRDGSQMSLMVPIGTLGVQLDAIKLEP